MTTAKWTINTGEQQDLHYCAARFEAKGCLLVLHKVFSHSSFQQNLYTTVHAAASTFNVFEYFQRFSIFLHKF
jgi:hypothetical protein